MRQNITSKQIAVSPILIKEKERKDRRRDRKMWEISQKWNSPRIEKTT